MGDTWHKHNDINKLADKYKHKLADKYKHKLADKYKHKLATISASTSLSTSD